MSDITVKINSVECKAQEGEYILNVARANGIFIPAICYLTRCSPTLACRICLVEADGKQVYACNAKVKNGMNIETVTENILKERRAIMEVYDVNHPLQCGVCDQSGSCELQNYTLELGVDSQSYAIQDTQRESANWSSVLHYDAGLCIVCERCVTVCKDMIGDSAIKTTARGGEALDKSYKDTMPKDAYAMWNKLQKSVIAPSNGTDLTNCSDCGECVAVCPVGALVSRDFVYTTNAWELTKIPATCAHCSSGCHIYYETKPTSIENRSEKIYRVTNEWNYMSLCGAGRFGYDFENKNISKDEKAFALAIEAFKKAKSIKFNATITNEEALMLQALKAKMGLKLVNHEVKAFQKFLNAYSNASGKSLYSSDFKALMSSDFIISVGSILRKDNPNARYVFNNVQKMNKGAGLYFHPIGDSLIPTFGKSVEVFNHKVGLEEAVCYLILDLFAPKDKLSDEVKEYLESFKDGDKNALVELLGKDSEKFKASFEKMLGKKSSFGMMVGEDFFYHEKSENLAKLIALIEQTTDINIAFIPPKSNALGVALICELDDEATGYTIGYNENGDFRLSALGDGDLDIPALNQQEGTLTNMNKKVVPTNVALEYNGYELNDIMGALMSAPRLAVDWCVHLPVDKGFMSHEFDSLPNHYTNAGEELRGYSLVKFTKEAQEIKVDKFDESLVLEGEIACRANPQRQFSDFTDKTHQINEGFALYVSKTKADGLASSKVEVSLDGESLILDVVVDDRMEGDIVALPDFQSRHNIYDLFGTSRYKTVTIKGV